MCLFSSVNGAATFMYSAGTSQSVSVSVCLHAPFISRLTPLPLSLDPSLCISLPPSATFLSRLPFSVSPPFLSSLFSISQFPLCRSFAQDIPKEAAIWNRLKANSFVTGLASTAANHIMGVKRCSWNDQFDYQMPVTRLCLFCVIDLLVRARHSAVNLSSTLQSHTHTHSLSLVLVVILQIVGCQASNKRTKRFIEGLEQSYWPFTQGLADSPDYCSGYLGALRKPNVRGASHSQLYFEWAQAIPSTTPVLCRLPLGWLCTRLSRLSVPYSLLNIV